MGPEQRVDLGRLLQQRARERNAGLGELERSGVSDFQDAERLAPLTRGVHEQPGLLRSILGGGGEAQGQQAGLLGHPLAKAALAGIAAMAIKKVLGARSATAAAAAKTTPPGGTRDIPSLPPPRDAQWTTTPAASTTAPSPAAAVAERWHVVASGESLWKIAARYYADGQQYVRIFEANRDVLADPDRIRPGQRLRIP